MSGIEEKGNTMARTKVRPLGYCSLCTRACWQDADGAAYTDAVSEYAALERNELRTAVLKLLTGPSPATSGPD